LIGNGWTDPANQYPAYASYAYKAGLVKEGSEKAKPIEDQLAICRNAMKNGIHVSINECEDILNTVLRVTRDEYEFVVLMELMIEMCRRAVSICTMYDYGIRILRVGWHGPPISRRLLPISE
jgi:carboxypeptidase C (cathepsin A)